MIVAIAMVRDESDILAFTLAHLIGEGVDAFVVADNRSKDNTRWILETFAKYVPITIVDDPEVGYYQARKMTRLAEIATDMGASWVLPFDADELFYADGWSVAEALHSTSAEVVQVVGWDHIPTADDRAEVRNPFMRITHRRPVPQKLPKVAFRPYPGASLHMGNHDVNRPGERDSGLIELRHFGYRSFGQFVRKVRNGKEAYDATDLHWNYGTHWRIRGGLPRAALEAEWKELLTEPDLVEDAAPYRSPWPISLV